MEDLEKYKTSRFLYVLEAAFEYFISLLVGGAYLAKVTSAIGISDSITGVLNSFVSLGFCFQLFAIFLANKRPVKCWVTILHSINQLAFALIYLVPFIKITKTQKTILFICFLLLGHIVNNIVNSHKLNWFMSLVDDKKRGSFTANKEIISLLGGMIFSFLMGCVIDYFEEIGNINGAFIVCGISVFVLAVLHTGTLIFSKERNFEEEQVPIKDLLKEILKDKNLFKLYVLAMLWSIANSITTPFYGTYQIKELGFSMTFVSILSIAYSIARAIFSRPLGKFADKYSFSKMLNICFVIMFVGFSINIFTTPANGKILYTIYYVFYAIGMAGINNGEMNLIYDYANEKKRVVALALKSTFAGVSGFLTALLGGLLVDIIQKNGNVFLGINLYAQQVVSAIGALVVLLTLLYLNTVVKNLKKEN